MMMKEKVMPPISNTGAERTKEEPVRALVDWVRVTFFDVPIEQVILVFLGMKLEDFQKIDKGRYRYRKTLRRGNISLYYDGVEEGMGILLDISGEGCRELESWEGFVGWKGFFEACLYHDCNFPRLDIAIDDRKGYFNMKQIEKKVDRKEVVSRFKGVEKHEKQSLSDDEPNGMTVMFGSRQSMVCIRFYDKLKERARKKKDTGGWDIWNRVEVELKDERAKKVVEYIAEGKKIGELVKGILAHYIRFVSKPRGADSNKRRWKTWRNWERFLKGVQAIKLGTAPEEKTIEENIDWIKRQVSKTMLKVVMAESMEFVEEIIVNDKNQLKLKPKDFLAIEAYRKKKARLRDQDGVRNIVKKKSS